MSDDDHVPRNDAEMAEYAREIRELGREAVGQIGQRLIKAKALCRHGDWLPWLEREFGWGERTAQRYMAIARALASNASRLTDLDIDLSALHLLAAPSTPPEVIDDVTTLGRRITYADVASRIVHEDDPAEIRANRYGAVVDEDAVEESPVRQVYAYRGEAEEQPVGEVRFQVEIVRENVVVPYYVPVDQPAPVPRTIYYTRAEAEDPAILRIREAAKEVRWNLRAIADALAAHQVGAIVATWDDDDRERVRKGVEAVEELKAALDRDNVVRFPGKPN
jgi:hypothetical protein